jgi:cytochrome c peroxidase
MTRVGDPEADRPFPEAFPWITFSDLWTLGGVAAIQEMQGPVIPWRPGRTDRDVSFCTPDGRLPDGSKEQSHLRAIFGRMGFNDQEIVALSGAHALGRCHTDRSGFEGPWTFSPTVFTNDYFRLLMEEKWAYKKVSESLALSASPLSLEKFAKSQIYGVAIVS